MPNTVRSFFFPGRVAESMAVAWVDEFALAELYPLRTGAFLEASKPQAKPPVLEGAGRYQRSLHEEKSF